VSTDDKKGTGLTGLQVTTGGQVSQGPKEKGLTCSTSGKRGTGLTGLQVTTRGQVSQVMAQVSTDDKRGTGLAGLQVTTGGRSHRDQKRKVSHVLQVAKGGQVSQVYR
jgi:hypothetical protein